MRAGDLVAERFDVVARAGAGGMGVVYRATDRLTGAPIALKVLHDPDAERGERFRREVRALASLVHPSIVRFVDAGLTPANEPYLAMEWLEGEDLSRHLVREGLSAHSAVALARRVLEALAYAHGKGVLHRDLKPSNVFLVGGDPEQSKLLDFGIARLDDATRVMTGTGSMLGSVGYMSPEQVRGDRLLDARSDLFSIGCVLFECLAGRPAFVGDHPISILVQSLHDRPPPLAELRPDLPPSLSQLVDRLLARARDERPPSAAATLAELDALGSLGDVAPAPRSAGRAVISGDERRMVSVILVRALGNPTGNLREAPTMADSEANLATKPLIAAVTPLGGKVLPLRQGAYLVLLAGRTAAQDEAAQAASCALAIHAALPDAHIAIATGPAEVSGRWAAGPVVDRALALLDSTKAPGHPVTSGTGIRIDDVTSGLLDVRFSVHGEGALQILAGARAFAGESRKVLGKPTPCVGRDREIAFLESTFSSCVEEEEARAVLLVAPAGVGKSRLRREIVGRLSTRDARVLVARCDALYAGSPHHAVSELVRSAAEIRDDASAEARRAALEAHVEAVLPPAARARASDFLGELLRAPSEAAPTPLLRAARNDPRVMGEQLREVFEEWLAALLSQRPLCLVLEDVHWSDPSSARLIEGAITRLAERPLFVLGLARPEIRELVPRPFASFHELPLEPLGKRAAERLVRSILGADADPRAIERIVARAAGNAFYLEELVRHVASHGDGSLPETVLAMARSRLDALEPDARRVLRIGSVFGECMWETGVQHLLGGTRSNDSVREWLEALVAREILEPGRRERFGGERDFVFRHALLRDAAYATLTEDDRRLAHRLAAGWLEDVGEREPHILAEHLLRAGELERAAPYLLKAAQARIDGGDLEGAATTAERGLTCRPTGGLRGRLLMVSAMARGFRSDWERSTGAAREALDLLSAGSVPWFQCASLVVLSGAAAGSPAAMFEMMQRIARLDAPPDPSQPYALTLFVMTTALVQLGQREMALAMGGRLEAASAASEGADPAFEGWRDLVRATLADKPKTDRLDEVLLYSGSALAALRECGDRLGEGIAGGWRGRALELAGAVEEAERLGREAIELTERTENAMTRKRALCVVGAALIGQGRHDEALAVLAQVPNDDAMAYLLSRVNVARSYLYRGDLARAEKEALDTAEAAGFFAPHKASALGVLAATRIAMGDAKAALADAREGRKLAASAGADVWTHTILRLAEIEALTALGASDEAALALREGHERIRAIAASLPEPAHRESFLRSRECARTLSLGG